MAIFTNKVFPGGGEAGSGGGIIQVVTAESTSMSQAPSSTNTWTDVAPTCSITMHESTNKVLISLSSGVTTEWAGAVGFKLLRGSTEVVIHTGYTWNNTRWQYSAAPFTNVVDSPGAGTHTYKVQIRSSRNTQFYWNSNQTPQLSSNDSKAIMTLMEFSS